MELTALETKRLHLGEIGQQHKEAVYAILSREDVMRYYGTDAFTEPEQAGTLIDSFREGLVEGRAVRWGIMLKENGRLIGTIGIHNWNKRAKKAEIGYELHPDYWGKGLAKEAVAAVLTHAFNELDLYRMGAVVYPANTVSSGMLKGMGFKEEGLLRAFLYQGGKSHDALMFSLLKPEWQGKS